MDAAQASNLGQALGPAIAGKIPGFDAATLRERAAHRTFARVVKESGESAVELKQAAESVAAANGPVCCTQRYVGRR